MLIAGERSVTNFSGLPLFDRLDAWQDSFRHAFSPERPLGPVDLGPIEDAELAAFLTDFENDSFQLLAEHVAIFLGRRGAGKSSVIKAFESADEVRRFTTLRGETRAAKLFAEEQPNDINRRYTGKVVIQMHEEQNRIRSYCDALGHPTIEHYVDTWTYRIWHHILITLSRIPDEFDRLPQPLRKLCRRYVELVNSKRPEEALESHDVIAAIAEFDGRRNFATLAAAMARNHQRFLVLADSMDAYDVNDVGLCQVVAGLVRLAAESGPLSNVAVFKVALPLEIYDRIAPFAAEDKIAVAKRYLRWSPKELIRIAAFRYLCYLRANDARAFQEARLRFDSHDERTISLKLLDTILGPTMTNECGQVERPLVFLLRHTQLLPRQVLIHLSQIITGMAASGARSQFGEPEIRHAILSAGEGIADHILESHEFRYPGIKAMAERVGRTMPNPIMSANQFHSQVFNKSQYPKSLDFQEFTDNLLRVGVLGVVIPQSVCSEGSSAPYVQARFFYANPSFPSWTEKDRLALHPVFAHRFRRNHLVNSELGAVMPIGTLDSLE